MKILQLVGFIFSIMISMSHAEELTLTHLLEDIERCRVAPQESLMAQNSQNSDSSYSSSTGAIDRASQYMKNYPNDPIVAYDRWTTNRAIVHRNAFRQQFSQELADGIRQRSEELAREFYGIMCINSLKSEEIRRKIIAERVALLEKTNYRTRTCVCDIDYWFSREEKKQILSFHLGWYNEIEFISDFSAHRFPPSLIDEIEKTQSCTPLENKWWKHSSANYTYYESSSLVGTFSFTNCSFKIE